MVSCSPPPPPWGGGGGRCHQPPRFCQVVLVPDPTCNNDGNGKLQAALQSQVSAWGNGVIVVVMVNYPATPATGTQTNAAFVVKDSAHTYQGWTGHGQGAGTRREKQMRQWTAILPAAKHAMQKKGSLHRRGHGRRCCGCMEDGKNVILSANSSLMAIPLLPPSNSNSTWR